MGKTNNHWNGALKIYLALVALLCILYAFKWETRHDVARQTRGEADARPNSNVQLHVSESSLDFGTVPLTPRMKWTLPIANTSDDPIEIGRFVTSCACASVEPSSIVIPARETKVVTIEITLTASTAEKAAKHDREVGVYIFAEIAKTGVRLPPWRIAGRVKTPLIATPPRLFLPVDKLRHVNQATVVLKAALEDEVNAIELEGGLEGRAEVEINRKTDNPAQFEVSIRPTSDLDGGDFTWMANFIAINIHGDRVGSLSYEIVGHVADDIVAMPDTLLYRFNGKGETITKELSVFSRSGKTIRQLELLLPQPDDFNMAISLNGTSAATLSCSKKDSHASSTKRELLQLVVALDGIERPIKLSIPVVAIP